jgi:hypothetical protein
MVPRTTYTTETRTRTVSKTRMESQQRTRTVPYTVNVPQTRTRSYNVTVYDNVTEQVPESYSVCVPVQSMKAVQVQVCKQVPSTVQVPVYSAPASSGVIMDSGASYGGGEVISGGYDSGASYGGGTIIDGGASYGGEVISGGVIESAPMATGAGCTNCSN